MKQDSPDYLNKLKKLENILTIYGRNPVLEALADKSLHIEKIHLASSNQKSQNITSLLSLCEKKGIPIAYHTREELSRISHNGKQDQGVAADIRCSHLQNISSLDIKSLKHGRLLALDCVTNPQNVGMIIRSACAGFLDGIILPKEGCSPINPLVIKASTGTVFKATIYRCTHLAPTLRDMKQQGFSIACLSASATQSLFDSKPTKPTIYILGNESTGVKKEVEDLCDQKISIPMNNGVESLNVAVTAALIAFYSK
jgi:23S rRNA (guanosine2251-2'-O)-methyltransferase